MLLKLFFSFGVSRQHSQSRENINFPEDELEGRSEGGIEEIGGSSSPGKMHPHQTHIHANLKMGFACQIYHTASLALPDLSPQHCVVRSGYTIDTLWDRRKKNFALL